MVPRGEVGLIFAGFYILTEAAGFSLFDWATILATFLVLQRTKIGPYPILGVVAVIYAGAAWVGA